MGTKINSQQAFELSKTFRDISVALGNYRFTNWSDLSAQNRQILESMEWSLLNASGDIRTLAVGIVLDETKLSYEKLKKVTSEAKDALEILAKVKKAVTIATAAVSLAGAIISQDFGAILNGASALIAAVSK